MKKRILILTVSIFIFVQMADVWANEGGASEKLNLKLRLKSGQKYGMRIIKKNKISQEIMGQQQNINHTKVVEIGLEVKKIDANGVASITVTYLTLKEKTTSAFGEFGYDSTDPCTAVNNPFAPTYAAMMGENVTMRVTPKGKIVEIKGIDEMFSRMAEKIIVAEDELMSKAPAGTCEIKKSEDAAAGKSPQEMSAEERAKKRIEKLNKRYGSRKGRKEAVKQMIKDNPLFSERQFKEMAGDVVMPFPGRVVGIGDSWEGKLILPATLPIEETDGRYALKANRNGVVVVDVSSKIDLVEETGPVKAGQGKQSMKVAGDYRGTLEIDETSGWMIRKEAKVQVSGEIKMGAGKQMPGGGAVPILMETVITVEPME